MLCRELNTSFVVGIFLVYGLSQGFAGSFFRVVSDFYWKDVQKMQPSAVQMYVGLYYIPWIMKPVWGFLTDTFPVRGYRRRPYFILAGFLGVSTALIISLQGKLPVALALLCLVGMAAGVAIADVTIDACIARNGIEQPKLAPDMQSLCGFVSSVGALIGYSSSGVTVHLLGAQGGLGLMAIPPAFLVALGFVIFELRTNPHSEERKVMEKVRVVWEGMGRTIRSEKVWKPALFMFLSISLSISTHEGHFYWYTDPKAGPAFSQEFVGMVYAIGAVASILGVLIYHKLLKGYPFRSLIFYAQVLYVVSGMLDLIFILRWNLKLGIPDYFFVVMEECFNRVVSRIRWMPMIVLSARLCPLEIEGTFFALLMCIDSLGSLSSKTIGGLMLHLFHVTRTDFRNLWLVAFIRNLLRMITLVFVFLVPNSDQSDVVLPPELLKCHDSGDSESLKLVAMEGMDEA
ncbi:putative folate-biopterin transporter 6 [Apostasia shenzhenica]|uniref:Putative folate-biopterin transporter 6 n=1 Tax=Apostasia shenzhenica TaxID=1088818 RepID=A0A2I0A1I3_9ASPA|nr:putative folate-biopterin transporter 6 [Apostasia shenzhenica]